MRERLIHSSFRLLFAAPQNQILLEIRFGMQSTSGHALPVIGDQPVATLARAWEISRSSHGLATVATNQLSIEVIPLHNT